MSASPGALRGPAQESSNKRKHEGDVKEYKKKKRKQQSEPTESNAGEEPQPRSDKKKKAKKNVAAEVEDAKGLVFEVNATPERADSSKKEKKKKKKLKESQEELDTPEAQEIKSQQSDIEIPDAPPTVQQPGTDTETTSTVRVPALEEKDSSQLQSHTPSSFHSIRMSMYLPIPPIGLDKATAAMLTLHVTPLLLTYFPPAGGVVLSIHDPVLSAAPQASLNQPLLPPYGNNVSKDPSHAYPKVGDELGACWAWLTVTFLVYSPQPGDKLEGWTNAMSEGFIGLVCYNYFQTSIAKSRIPKTWSWSGPTRETRQRKTPKKGRLNDDDGSSQDNTFDSQETVVVREDDAIDGTAGTFVDGDGVKIPDRLQFQVVDLEMIPAQERGQLALQVEGTLLNPEDEANVREEEREKFEIRVGKSRARSRTPGTPIMSGGLATHSRASSAIPAS